MFVSEGDDPVALGPISMPVELQRLVRVMALMHPGASAEWLFTNDPGSTPEPLGVHIGDPEGNLDIIIEEQGRQWVGQIGSWRLPKPQFPVLCEASVASVALRIAMAAAVALQVLSVQAQAIIVGG